MEVFMMTREQFFNDVDLVTKLAISAGVKGEVYQTISGKGKKCRLIEKHKPLNNLDLYNFGKVYHREVVAEAVRSGKPVPAEVLADYTK